MPRRLLAEGVLAFTGEDGREREVGVELFSDETYRLLEPAEKARRFPRPASPRPKADDGPPASRRGGASGGTTRVGPSLRAEPGPVFNSPDRPRAGNLINSGGRGSKTKVLT